MNESARAERLRCAALLAGAAGIWGALGLPALSRKVYVFNDLGDYFLPVRAFYARAIEQGHGFLWFPDIYTGHDLHAEGGAALLHPLNWLPYALLPLDLALNFELLRSYPIALAGTYLLLRRWNLQRDAALFGALVFSFGGFNLTHYLHMNAVAVAAHMPWLLWAADVALRDPSRRKAALARLAAAALVASALLHGYPQYLLFAGFALAAYVLLLMRSGATVRSVVTLALLMACGAAAGGVQLVPTIVSLSESVRSDPTAQFLNSFSLLPINLLQPFGPYVFEHRVVGGNPHEFALYPGAALPPLCIWLWMRRRELGPTRSLATMAAAVAALSLVLALGEHGLLYRLLVELPLLDLFRAPSRYIVLLHFSLAILAAIAFSDLLQTGRRESEAPVSLHWLAVPPLLALFAIGGAFAWQISGAEPPARAASIPLLAASFVLLLTASALVAAIARGSQRAALALIVFVALDQGTYGLAYAWREPAQSIDAFAASLDRPPGGTRGQRVRGQKNDPSLAGFRNVGGYAALAPTRKLGERLQQQSHLNVSRGEALRVSSVAWMRVPAWDRLDGIPNRWLRIDDPMPRARMVPHSRTSEDVWRDLVTIDIRQTALVSQVLDLPGGAAGQVRLVEDLPGSLRLQSEAVSRQLLVVSEAYHAGWTARIDGEPARLLRVYDDFLGCIVPAGAHEIALDFDPPSLRQGAALSLAGILVAVALTGVSVVRRDR